jgi:hypothetical protein
VARLRAAGAIVLGKTNVGQLLFMVETDNPSTVAPTTRRAPSAARADHRAARGRSWQRRRARWAWGPTSGARCGCRPPSAGWWRSSPPPAAATISAAGAARSASAPSPARWACSAAAWPTSLAASRW